MEDKRTFMSEDVKSILEQVGKILSIYERIIDVIMPTTYSINILDENMKSMKQVIDKME